jgi:hypothetical protein
LFSAVFTCQNRPENAEECANRVLKAPRIAGDRSSCS